MEDGVENLPVSSEYPMQETSNNTSKQVNFEQVLEMEKEPEMYTFIDTRSLNEVKTSPGNQPIIRRR